ncbi:hypothetical protein BCR33DRAFT_849918 [Rhizoclosmatium globosum]|uniref:Glycosyltransferase family 32 protein n=1 Tax=Rhizoclosmatium globosum TaxID=329046 RepID=A0A1Y2CF98_9FUNG|nr:hypothetical protein BCR33DRAFT_849918 [Rhizoclosmatium globosum]|eukprot:ORY45702.1 hypothetical protein BCR33DRAFT_849918 [Rhizoclosmatium globosum]
MTSIKFLAVPVWTLHQKAKLILALIIGITIITTSAYFTALDSFGIVTRHHVKPHHIDPNDKEALISSGCFVDPLTYKPETLPNNPLPDTDLDAWHHIAKTCSATTKASLHSCPIPNAYHGIFGNNMTFRYHHYISLKSVHDIIQPFAMYIHGYNFPLNDTLFQRAVKEFNLIMVPSRSVTHVLGVRVLKPEHISDMLRLESVLAYGGFYADFDVWFLKPLHRSLPPTNTPQPETSFLTEYEAVLGEEDPNRFGNGIILSKRCGRFLSDWYKQYLQFDNKGWGVYDGDAFHLDLDRMQKPNWSNRKLIHTPQGFGRWNFSQNVAVHLWYKEYRREVGALGEEQLVELDNPLTRMGRYIMWGDKRESFQDGNAYHLNSTQ